jgi:hypothetical protein
MTDNNAIIIHSWMLTDLDLHGNDLLVYAIIYTVCQDGKSKFYGGTQYLADWCGCTRQGVIKNIQHLIESGLIQKTEETFQNGMIITGYITTPIGGEQSLPRGKQSSPGGKQSLPNPYSNNTTNNNTIIKNKNIKNKNKIVKAKNSYHFQDILDCYNQICTNLPQAKAMTEKRKAAISNILKKYKMADIKMVFEKANASSFLTGKNDRGWKADIDFILREDKFISIVEGKYDEWKSSTAKKKFGEIPQMVYTKAEKGNNKHETRYF